MVSPARPDSGYSWVIAFCCSYMHFALFGLFRSAGVVYVALIDMFHVPREEAAWPFAICAGVFQLTGPATGFLTMCLSLRQTALLASTIATVGIASCYFASTITWMNLCYGVVHGIGFGIITSMIPVIIDQYFVKHKATAIGIAFTGGTLSSMIFPIVLEWMLKKYTLKESLLLLSGVVMNMLVAASLLRAPPWLQTPNQSQKLLRNSSEGKDSGLSISTDSRTKDSIPGIYSVSEKDLEEEKTGKLISNTESFTDNSDEKLDDTVFSNDSVLFGGSNSKMNVAVNLSIEVQHQDPHKNDDVQKPLMGSENIFIVPAKGVKNVEEPYRGNNIRNTVMSILKEPMFYLITFTMNVFFLGAHSFFLIIVDYSKDKGIPEDTAVYFMSVFSFTDMIGRAGLGWVTDRGYMKAKSMITLNLIVLVTVYNIYPSITSLTGMLVLATFHGVAVGSSITLYYILLTNLGSGRLAFVIGMNSFFNGILSFPRPFIIGLFRDVVGSYDSMLYFNGALTLLFALFWLFIVILEKRKEHFAKQQNENL